MSRCVSRSSSSAWTIWFWRRCPLHLAVSLAVVTAVLAGTAVASAQEPGNDPKNNVSVVSQAPIYECFMGINPDPRGTGLQPGVPAADGTCPNGGRPRANHDYFWGFATGSEQQSLWWGTGTNFTCAAVGDFAPAIEKSGLGVPSKPFELDELACEYGQSWLATNHVSPSIFGLYGDNRQQRIYEYKIATGQTIEHTQQVLDADPASADRLRKAGGIRSIGSHNGVVLVTASERGQTETGTGGQGGGVLDIFAFRESDGAYLGSAPFNQWNNAKSAMVIDGHLYFGMALTKPGTGGSSSSGKVTGELVKWTGTPEQPFGPTGTGGFETVARVGNQPSYFTKYGDRIVANCWVGTGSDEPPGLYVSPPLGDDGQLNAADADKWTGPVFDAGDFFTDHTTALAQYGMGAISWKGWLYFNFSTVGVGQSTLAHFTRYGELKRSNLYEAGLNFLRSEPAGTVLRARNLLSGKPEVQLLYGNERYWRYDQTKAPTNEDQTNGKGRWRYEPNKLGQKGRFGRAGFGDRFTDYVGWNMTVFRDQLYLGGFNPTKVYRDYFLNPGATVLNEFFGTELSPSPQEKTFWGNLLFNNRFQRDKAGNVWVFEDPERPAKPLTENGFNNQSNWGVRDFFPINDQVMYMGTQGGWDFPSKPPLPQTRAGFQLVKYAPPSPTPPLPPAPPRPQAPTIPVSLLAAPSRVAAGDMVTFVSRVRAPSRTVVFEICVTLPAGFQPVGNSGARDGRDVCIDTRVAPGASRTVTVRARAGSSRALASAAQQTRKALARSQAVGVSPAGEAFGNDSARVGIGQRRRPAGGVTG